MSASPPTASPVHDLIARTRTGDPAALGELYARHARPLLAVARRLTGSAADAEDVLHDVFLGLPEALRRYEERGTLEAWLKRVTARVALNRLRTHDRSPVSLDAGRRGVAVPDGATAPRSARVAGVSALPAAPATPDVLDALDVLALQDAIDALPDALRVVLVLKEIEGYAHAEIAALLDITRGASEVRLHRAIAMLRRRLTGEDHR